MSYPKSTRTILGALEVYKKENALSKDYFLRHFNETQRKWIVEFDTFFQMFFGGRRGGKTVGNIGKVIYCDLYHKPKRKSGIFVVCSTKESAEELYWDKISRFNKKFKLGYKFDKEKMKIYTPRNTITLLGLYDYKAVSKKLGQAVKLVIVDEAQTLKDALLKEFVDDVSVWSGFDHRGVTCLSGNPPAQHFGTVYQMWTEAKERGVFTVSTNIFKNPRFKPAEIEERLSYERTRRKLVKGQEDAAFRRMALGEWVLDNSSVIFKPKDINYYKELPAGSYTRVVGLDFGLVHHDAICVLTFSTKTKEIFLEYEWQKQRQDISMTCQKVVDVCDQYDTSKVIYDPGALGSKIGLELTNRYGQGRISFEAANNKEKMSWIEILKAEIESGKFKLKKDGIFAQECPQILFNDDHSKVDDKRGLHSDIMPAIIYALKDVYNWSEESTDKTKQETAKITMREYVNEQTKKALNPEYESYLDNMSLSNEDISY